jgi:ElaB/YqjD/DUF883 family membrane-anchored ribosome-binding protein
MSDMQSARQKLVNDFSTVIDDSEELLKALATAGGEKATSIRGDLQRKLGEAKVRLKELESSAMERASAAAKQADEYVHENPWQSIGGIAALAVIIGIVVGLMLNRR